MPRVKLSARTEYVEVVGTSKHDGRVFLKVGTEEPPHSKDVIMTVEEALNLMSALWKAIDSALPEAKPEN